MNPCPKTHPCNFLRAYFTFFSSLRGPPINGLRTQVVRIQSSGTDTPQDRSPLVDAHVKATVLNHRTEADLSSYQCSIARYCNVISCVYI